MSFPVILLIVSTGVLLVATRRALSATALPVLSLVVALCGVWMTFTHVPLVMQAVEGMVP